MTESRSMLILALRGRTTRAAQDFTRRTIIRITILCPTRTINIMLPEILHICKHLRIVLWGSTQILDNIRLTRVLGVPSNRALPHSCNASTEMGHNAFTQIMISYLAITEPRNTCKAAKTKKCTISETGTHTTCPSRPIRLNIPPVAPPTSSVLPNPIAPTPAYVAGHLAKGITLWLKTTLRR